MRCAAALDAIQIHQQSCLPLETVFPDKIGREGILQQRIFKLFLLKHRVTLFRQRGEYCHLIDFGQNGICSDNGNDSALVPHQLNIKAFAMVACTA